MYFVTVKISKTDVVLVIFSYYKHFANWYFVSRYVRVCKVMNEILSGSAVLNEILSGSAVLNEILSGSAKSWMRFCPGLQSWMRFCPGLQS